MSDLADLIAIALSTNGDNAVRVEASAITLWDTLADLGMVDSYGSVEHERLLPFALAIIHAGANAGPTESVWDAIDTAYRRVYGH